ncbi:hypothetical protein [Nostoc sp. PCC 7107]|uniref:hypothetical protein n=1 Tax=Nostoc sp. PCC 7107 TaxID=317936 RepID=UPI00030ADBC0|nr:hypothetical protein [Nostoc sp. PCC 7107]
MEIVYSRCAGLDVNKKTVVACAITPKSSGGCHKEIQTFGTMTSERFTTFVRLVDGKGMYSRSDGKHGRVLAASI